MLAHPNPNRYLRLEIYDEFRSIKQQIRRCLGIGLAFSSTSFCPDWPNEKRQNHSRERELRGHKGRKGRKEMDGGQKLAVSSTMEEDGLSPGVSSCPARGHKTMLK
jgi:hypothetical protein